VSVNKNSFKNRKDLCFKGEPLEVLKEKTGIEDVVFVHASGFIGGAKSFQGALRLAELSIEMN